MTLQNVYFKSGDLEEIIELLHPMTNPVYEITDELTNGKLFADVFGSIARYNTTARSWYGYDGIVWKIDEGNVITENLAQRLMRALWVYVARHMSESPSEREKAYQHFVNKLGDRQKRLKMIEDAKSMNCINADTLDANGTLLNCQNCVIDLKTFERLEHDSNMNLSKVAKVVYDPEVYSADWEKFVTEVMQDDSGKIEYLQKLFGYALTAENTQEQCYMCYGATTRNGKSTMLETIGNMLGDYSMNLSPETLAQRQANSRNASGDIARLKGCRFLHCSEPSKRMIFNVELLKTLLGRDKITARNLYEREFEFVPIFKLFMNTNFLPTVNDDTLFSSGRIKIITFDRHFNDNEQDRGLKDRLLSSENLSGILNWCLIGLRKYYQDGVLAPESVVRATDEYRQKSDKVRNFTEECLEEDASSNVSAKNVYDVYSGWCKDNGFGVENKGNFFQELKAKGLLSDNGTVEGVTKHNVIKGYAITTDAMQRYGERF